MDSAREINAPLVSPLKASMAPVVDERTRVLVLGSLPGEASLAAQCYYAHPRNHFWLLMGAVLETDMASLSYEERLKRLLSRGVGLWDVVASARRRGSLDQQLRDVTPNALPPLLRGLPDLRAVAFNGAKSAQLARRQLTSADASPVSLCLPSSSPALTLPFAQKLASWRELRVYLAEK